MKVYVWLSMFKCLPALDVARADIPSKITEINSEGVMDKGTWYPAHRIYKVVVSEN
jgi:hypothetical protein